MSWYNFWSDGIKKRTCRYLIQRYLGRFLEEKLTLDQLSVDIYNGTGSVSEVSLDVQALNELVEQKNLPIEFVDGFMSGITVSIPWATLLKDSIFIEVSGMQITVQPRQRTENGESMLESMWSSVSSGIQIPAEYLKPDISPEDDKFIDEKHQVEGMELFVRTLESLLTRVKIKFVDTILRLEHFPKEGKNGIAFEIKAENFEYCDEAICEEEEDFLNGSNKKYQPVSSFTTKKFHADGISFYTDEFPLSNRTFSRSVLEDLTQKSDKEDCFILPPILIGKLSGVQDVRIKYKKSESLDFGPKFELDFSLGSLSLFLSPRQLHLLIEIMHSLSFPQNQDSSNIKYKIPVNKPISAEDYVKIQKDILENIFFQGCSTNPQKNARKGWASNSVEESEVEFFPFTQQNSMSASQCSSRTDVSWETSASTVYSKGDYSCSSVSGSCGSGKKSEKGNIFGLDINGENIAFHFRLSSASIVILHDDILTFSHDTFCLSESSVSTMNNLSSKFFQQLDIYGVCGFGIKDFEDSKSIFQKACNLDHLIMMAAAVIIEGKEGGTNSSRCCNTRITAGNFEVSECLFEPNSEEPQYVELLKFMKHGCSTPVAPYFPYTNQPDVSISITQSKKTKPNYICTESKIIFSLQQCWSELDLSLLDRLSTIVTCQTLCHTKSLPKDYLKPCPFYEAFESAIVTDKNISLKVQCPFLVVKFRFPIPDMRPDIEKGRHPWWKRSIRKDVLYMNFVDPIFQTEINYQRTFTEYKIQCSQLSLLLQIGDSDIPVPFLYTAPVDKNDSNKKTFYEHPRLSFKHCLPKPIDEIEFLNDKEDSSGLTCSFMETPKKESSPFISKRFVHKNNSPSSVCGEEIILPATKEDLNTFMNEILENSKYQLNIVLPYIHVDFSSKHIYEVLYNRFTLDVALWQSSVSKIVPMNLHSSDIDDLLPKPFLPDSFHLFKTGLKADDTESEEEMNDGKIFINRLGTRSVQQSPSGLNNQSHLALKLHIDSGHLSLSPNLKDSLGNIVPDKHGQFCFALDKANLFIVSNCKGVPQKNYHCFQVEDMTVFHEDTVNNSCKSKTFNQMSFRKQSQSLKRILYKSKVPLVYNKQEVEKTDMFKVSMSSNVDNRKIKTVRISCGINGAVLRHFVTPSELSWLTQIRDFFDVVDYPVKGYDSPQSIKELYLNVEDSAVDYRPKYISTNCVLYLGNFSISSNIAARTKTSTMRFIAEESNLFLSEKNLKTDDEINLRSDFVSVIDLGLFELSLRLSDNPGSPKVDLKASSDIFNIRTCVDSASSLAKLITYYTFNGDLNLPEKEDDNPQLSEPYMEKTIMTKENNSSAGNNPEEFCDIMADAMKDLAIEEQPKPYFLKENDVDVFYFPDEGKRDECEQAFDWGAGDFDSDCDDFIIVNHEDTNPVSPEELIPVVRFHTEKSIQLIENHFNISLAKTDFLLPPKNYPLPVYRYTLSDMNLVWHMFGGKDFDCLSPSKKNISFDIQERNNIKVNSYRDEGSTETVKKKKKKDFRQRMADRKWFTSGGPGRELNILMQFNFSKVRFQHEIYPENTTQASRQVLLIHNFEIRDKLSNSQINKFLYQYSSESSPRQSNANMVMIKIAHLRPDARRNVQEACLKISLLPLRLNIDQDSLEFLFNFFCSLSTISEDTIIPSSNKENITPADQGQPSFEFNSQRNKSKTSSKSSNQSAIYIRNFVFCPDVPIRIDYEGKRVNMNHGPLTGILMGLAQLNCLQIKLKKLSYKHGLLGWNKLFKYVFREWLDDIKASQLPSIIGGVGFMHALVQLFGGIYDLFWLPIEQYQKDGRIFRGLQRGANSFTTSTVIAALELTARVVQAIQSIAESAYDMLSPGPSVRRIRGKKSKKQLRYCEPADIREGVTNAYTLVKEGLEETAETLVRVASAEAEQKGAVGAVGGVLRQIPPSMVAPIIIASAATSNLLGGVRNQLAPDSRREASFKWKANET